MISELSARLAGKNVLILGIGNRLRGDDGVGSLLIERLQGKVNVPMIDAGDVPENYLGPIEASGANLVLVVDATDLGARPGDTALLELDQIAGRLISTHTTNLSVLFKVIPADIRPQVILLGIQPGNLDFGQGLSEPVRKTLEGLERILVFSLNL
jgi:hydrogenase 3 maturation protease